MRNCLQKNNDRSEGPNVNFKFWKNKRVFITGHTGFKGSWLAIWLQYMEAVVEGYALKPPTTPSIYELTNIEQGMTSVEADIRDFEKLVAVLEQFQPEIIFHLAAQPLVLHSYKHPIETYSTNVMGTVHLFAAIRQIKSVRAVLNVTSDKCYENQERVWSYRENEPLGGYDPYSTSKACSELITSSFRDSFFKPNGSSQHRIALASARAGNVIGGGDWAKDRLIPDCIKAWLSGRVLDIRYPQATRPWQHVLEPLTGYLLLAQRLFEEGLLFAEAWNFGPGEESEQSVLTVVEQLAAFWGEGAQWQTQSEGRTHEAQFLKLDCSKAQNRLGWTFRWKLATALQKTVAWYQIYQKNPQQLRKKTLEQIQEYIDTPPLERI